MGLFVPATPEVDHAHYQIDVRWCFEGIHRDTDDK